MAGNSYIHGVRNEKEDGLTKSAGHRRDNAGSWKGILLQEVTTSEMTKGERREDDTEPKQAR